MNILEYITKKAEEGLLGSVEQEPKVIAECEGEANRVYVISFGNKKIVFKQSKPEDRWKNLDREFQILDSIKNLGLGSPNPYFFDFSMRLPILTMEYLEGETLGMGTIENHLEEIALSLKRLHRTDVSSDLFSKIKFSKHTTFFDYLEEIGAYVKMRLNELRSIGFNRDQMAVLEKIVKTQGRKKEERKKYFLKDEFCLCHKDIRPENIIINSNGKVMLIDWQHSNRADPAIDITCLLRRAKISRQGKEKFFSVYGDSLEIRERVDAFFDYGRVPGLLWFLDRTQNPRYHFSKEKRDYYRSKTREFFDEMYQDTIITRSERDYFSEF